MENPEYVIGIPLALLGALGLAAAFSLFALPADGTAAQERASMPRGAHAGAHPQPSEYIVIGIVLAFITAVEVALYYIDGMNRNFLIALLLALSTAKFIFVVAWFMHLKFDNAVLTVAFVTGLFLAFGAFAVVLMSLNAGLV